MFSSSSSSSLIKSLLGLSSTSIFYSLSQPKYPHFLLWNPFFWSPRFFASRGSKQQHHSFKVSYLTKQCGLTEEDALSVAKVVFFNSPAKPNLVVEFFRSRGFLQSQISYVIKKLPKVLCLSPERTLLPKFDFLRSRGFSDAEVRKLLLVSPYILSRSLEGHIVPSFDFLSKVLCSDQKTLSAIRRYPSLLVIDTRAEIVPKMKLLQDHGVSKQNVAFFLYCQPRHVKTPHGRFQGFVERVKEMGISPSKVNFVIAVQVLGQLSQLTWDRKLEVYSRWGWSEETTLRAFVKYPWVMTISESKIMAVMGYYTKEMGLVNSYIAEHPVLLSLSLEKRTKPRCSVFRYLRSKGLIGDVSLNLAMSLPEAKFLEKYVTRFPEESKHLLSLYREKMGSKVNKEKPSLSSDPM